MQDPCIQELIATRLPWCATLLCTPLCHNHPNQVKGRTLLVGASSCSAEELLAVAEASAAGTALWKAKRQMKRAEAAEARAEKAARKAGGRTGE